MCQQEFSIHNICRNIFVGFYLELNPILRTHSYKTFLIYEKDILYDGMSFYDRERDILWSSNPCLNVHLIINMYGTGTLIEAPHPVSRFTTLFTFESNFLLCQMKILQSQDRQALQKPHRKTLCNVGNQIQLQCQESSLNWISGNSD